jgi:hypothetical protein
VFLRFSPQRALRNLARIDLVQISDYYDASMCLLALRLAGGEGRWSAVPPDIREVAAARVEQWCRCGREDVGRPSKKAGNHDKDGEGEATGEEGQAKGINGTAKSRSLLPVVGQARTPGVLITLPYTYTRIIKAHIVSAFPPVLFFSQLIPLPRTCK